MLEMDYSDPHFRSRRPLRIAVLGAKGVGKTTLALQFVTNETQVGTLPTTIEDIYRKEARITLSDEDTIKRIKQNLVDNENDKEVLLEETFRVSPKEWTRKLADADVSLSLKITDTAGYDYHSKSDSHHSSRKLLSRWTLRRKQGNYHVNGPDKKKNEDLVDVDNTYSKMSNPHEAKAKERLENSMVQCDGVILVYSVLDDTTFAAACELRNKFVQMRTSMIRSHSEHAKPSSNIFSKLPFVCCREEEEEYVPIPPVFLVGTHADARVQKMLQENSSRMYDINFLHGDGAGVRGDRRLGGKKRKLGKTLTAGRTSIHPHDVYPVISEWKECAGFAEITSTDAGLVKQIFEKLNIAIVTPSE